MFFLVSTEEECKKAWHEMNREVSSIAIAPLLGALLRSCLHSCYKCLSFAFSEILVRIIEINTNSFILVVLVSNFTAGYRSLYSLLVSTKACTTPAHFPQQLMPLVALVQTRFLRSFARIGSRASVRTKIRSYYPVSIFSIYFYNT